MLGLSSEGKAASGKGGSSKSILVVPELRSFPGVREAEEQDRVTDERRRKSETKIKEIERSLDLRARAQSAADSTPVNDRAEALLRGEEVSTTPIYSADDLARAYDEHSVIVAASQIVKSKRSELLGQASVETCKKFAPDHLDLLKRVALLAIALFEAMDDEVELCRAIRVKGFEITWPIAGHPRLSIPFGGGPENQNSALFGFLKALRAAGVAI